MSRARLQDVTGKSQPQLLAGVTVVELATVIAAPSACALLADHGANVIKVERPGGDSWRNGLSMFENDNRGKRSISLDISHPSGMKVFVALVKHADVFVTNLRECAHKAGYRLRQLEAEKSGLSTR